MTGKKRLRRKPVECTNKSKKTIAVASLLPSPLSSRPLPEAGERANRRMSFGTNGVSLGGGGTWGTNLPPRGIIVRGTESGFRVVRVVAGEQGREYRWEERSQK